MKPAQWDHLCEEMGRALWERRMGNKWLSMKTVRKSFRDSVTQQLDLSQNTENDEKNQMSRSLPVAPADRWQISRQSVQNYEIPLPPFPKCINAGCLLATRWGAQLSSQGTCDDGDPQFSQEVPGSTVLPEDHTFSGTHQRFKVREAPEL